MVIAGYLLENIVILIDNNTWVSCVFLCLIYNLILIVQGDFREPNGI